MTSDYKHLEGDRYNQLYARYHENASRLLTASSVVLGSQTKLLDICTGSGVIIHAAIEMGLDPRNIAAIDRSPAMMALNMPMGVVFGAGDVRNVHLYPMLGRGPYHLVTCRQAVNYWWSVEAVESVASVLAPGGVFVFNTFHTEPPESPTVRKYTYQGHDFVEIAYRIGRTVHHVQARDGLPSHATTFMWIPPSQFHDDLDTLVESFDIAEWSRIRDGATDTYIVRVKKDS